MFDFHKPSSQFSGKHQHTKQNVTPSQASNGLQTTRNVMVYYTSIVRTVSSLTAVDTCAKPRDRLLSAN